MDMLLGGLAFAAIIFGQFAAVVAVHGERKRREFRSVGPTESRSSHKADLGVRELTCGPVSHRDRDGLASDFRSDRARRHLKASAIAFAFVLSATSRVPGPQHPQHDRRLVLLIGD